MVVGRNLRHSHLGGVFAWTPTIEGEDAGEQWSSRTTRRGTVRPGSLRFNCCMGRCRTHRRLWFTVLNPGAIVPRCSPKDQWARSWRPVTQSSRRTVYSGSVTPNSGAGTPAVRARRCCCQRSTCRCVVSILSSSRNLRAHSRSQDRGVNTVELSIPRRSRFGLIDTVVNVNRLRL